MNHLPFAALLLPLLAGIVLILLRAPSTALHRLLSIAAVVGLVAVAVALLLLVSDGQRPGLPTGQLVGTVRHRAGRRSAGGESWC